MVVYNLEGLSKVMLEADLPWQQCFLSHIHSVLLGENQNLEPMWTIILQSLDVLLHELGEGCLGQHQVFPPTNFASLVHRLWRT